jgi:CHAT domain-containing protein/lipopolysaccharide biosynthesis regulator YciM
MPAEFNLRYRVTVFKWRLNYSILLLIFLIFKIGGIAQQRPNQKQVKNWEKTADSLYSLENPSESTDQRALQLFILIADADSLAGNDIRIKSLIKAGNIHQGYSKYVLANEFYHRALKSNKPFKPTLAYEAYLYLGSSMYFNSIIDSAQFYFEMASNLADEFRKRYVLPEQDRLYNSLGAIYFEAANYQQAINYFKIALMLSSPEKEDFQEFFTTIQSNLAQCLLKLNMVDSSLQILKKLKPASNQKDFILQNIAHAYYEKGAYDSSLKLYSQLPITKGLQRVLALNDIGRIYLKKGKWKQSSQMFDSAIAENRRVTGSLRNKEEALSYLSKAELAEKMNRLDIAISWCNKALEEIHLSFTCKQPFDLPVQISKTVSPIIFYQILNYKADLIYKKYQAEKKPALLEAALQTVVKAVECAIFVSKNLDNDDAKLFFIKNAQKYYELGVKIAYEASNGHEAHLQDLIFILEGYKGNILRQNFEFTNLKLNSGIPDSLTRKEREMKGLYAVYLTKLNQATSEKESGRMQKKLDSIMVSLSRLQKSYEKFELFTWVKNSKADHRTTLSEIREDLDSKTALVNYFVTSTEIYMLAISKKKVKVARVPISPEFSNSLKKYLDECFRLTEGVRYEGYSASREVFRHLMEPVYSVVSNCSRLVIIPDKYLFQLPFDGLLTSAGPRDYLVKHHSISFHYSFSLFLQGMASPNNKTLSEQGILAFAPFSAELKKLGSTANLFLPFSGQEINSINARKYFSSQATKQQFLKEYKNYGILHLATHASLGNDSSSNWIQFYPNPDTVITDRLYVHEVYNLQLEKNGLVILSACESGSGLAISGEGLMSLSRAFMYAGAGGIISTLYKTDDRVTAFLMKRFYFHMERGLDPSDALQQSKIDLLETDELNPRLKTPNYWSNFVYNGKITRYKNNTCLWLIPVMLTTGIVFYFIRKKRKALLA